MKLILAIIQDYDVDPVLRALTSAGMRVTRFAGVGGFLSSSNTMLMIGVQDVQVQTNLSIIEQNSQRREESIVTQAEAETLGLTGVDIAPVVVGGAVILILPVERFERLF